MFVHKARPSDPEGLLIPPLPTHSSPTDCSPLPFLTIPGAAGDLVNMPILPIATAELMSNSCGEYCFGIEL